MCSNPSAPHALWPGIGHYLLPVYSHPNQPFHQTWRYFGGQYETASQVEYHHYYGLNPLFLTSPCCRCQQPYVWPSAVNTNRVPALPRPQSRQSWPEGASLKVGLQWGKPQRVYGPHRDLPEFVTEDLRRVYGTYPRTDVSITYRGGEYVVRGDPHVGSQEYRVEKKVVRQLESPREPRASEIAEGRRKK